jgi:hypothetical protein
MSASASTLPNCNRCSAFFITYDAARPYGCRAMGFQSAQLPCQVVLQASGEVCLHFQPKPARQAQGKQG